MKSKYIIFCLISVILVMIALFPTICTMNPPSQLPSTNSTTKTPNTINPYTNTPKSTQQNTQTNYNSAGKYTVTSTSQSDYSIYYPKNISSQNKSFPLITWGNGINTTPRIYSQLISHIVSHGFVVVASNSGNVGSGSEMIAAIDYIQSLSKDKNSEFYNKIDFSNIGATGHSLGGRGTLNAASKDSRIKCIVPIQPAGADDVRKVSCPMFLITSTNDTVLNSDQFVKPLFDSSLVPTVYASLVGEPHTAPVTCCKKLQGYVTAWLCMYLQSDNNVTSYFTGDNSVLKQDSNWTNIQIKNF